MSVLVYKRKITHLCITIKGKRQKINTPHIMKKLFLIITGLLTLANGLMATSPQQRKKVGLVLSGGGAKGMAHIGAIKVIEEAGIPIDYVV